jgi:hypothetical protein
MNEEFDFDKLLKWMNVKWKLNRKCDICGKTGKKNWNFHDILQQIPQLSQDSKFLQIPVVTAICKNCGNIKMFMAKSIGLADEKGNLVKPGMYVSNNVVDIKNVN